MDETGTKKFAPYKFDHDAQPSTSTPLNKGGGETSKMSPEIKKRKAVFPDIPEVEPKEDSTAALISVLLKTLLETTFRFKDEEEKALLTQMCKTLIQQEPEKKVEIGEIVDLFYEVEDGSSIEDVAAQFRKKHVNAEKAPVAAETATMEIDTDAVPSNTPANLEMEAKRQKKLREMKPELLCKVCLDNQVAVTFVPCGHLVTCVSCTAALFECPVCRAHIRGTIRTYI